MTFTEWQSTYRAMRGRAERIAESRLARARRLAVADRGREMVIHSKTVYNIGHRLLIQERKP